MTESNNTGLKELPKIELWYISSTTSVRTRGKRYHKVGGSRKGSYGAEYFAYCKPAYRVSNGHTVEVDMATLTHVVPSQKLLCEYCIRKAKKDQEATA